MHEGKLYIYMLIHDLRCLGSKEYNLNELTCEPLRITRDHEVAITMAYCNKDSTGNCHEARRYH